MQSLSEQQTQRVLREYGLCAPLGAGFSFCDPQARIAYGWHSHDYDQLLYNMAGVVQLETQESRYALPAAHAAWIPAGVPHRTFLTDAECISLYLAPDKATETLRIVGVDDLLREMILHARRWPLGAAQDDAVAQSYFATLALLCAERLKREQPLAQPNKDIAVQRAMAYATADLARANVNGAAVAARLSERSLRRRFAQATGLTWQSWLTQTRILAAMCLLAEGARVTDAALQVGFSSLSAFAQAFARISGETPSAYRARFTRQT